MNFNEAYEALKEGKFVCRESWKPEEGYLCLMKGMKYVWKIIPWPNPNAGNHIYSAEEIEATDWVEYIEKPVDAAPVVDAA